MKSKGETSSTKLKFTKSSNELAAELAQEKTIIVLDSLKEDWIICTPEELESKASQAKLHLKIKNLLKLFAIQEHEYDKIFNFIAKHNFLDRIVRESFEQIKKIFGENAKEVSLQIYEDTDEDLRILFAVVKTSLPVHRSLDFMDKLEDEWLLDNVTGETALIFSITVRAESA